MSSHLLLVINPGSTSTKLSHFVDTEERFAETLAHSTEELAAFSSITAQAPFRRAAIDDFLTRHRIDPETLSAVVARGGLLRPLEGGVYAVDDAMVRDLTSGVYGHHASNLGGVLARSIADAARCPAFIADPVVVDELEDVLAKEPALVGMIAVPRAQAQEVADRLVAAGVSGLINFAPVRIKVPDGLYVEHMDITTSAEKALFFARERARLRSLDESSATTA